jgi:hypothetical protein
MVDRADIAERFAALAPWDTKFVVDGESYGGELDYSRDERVPRFFEWFGVPRRIVDLRALEGALTLQLAAPPEVEHVLALEPRSDRRARAALATALLGRGNIVVVERDPADIEPVSLGRFDAAFCSGVVHRLERPWELLAALTGVSDRLFVDTHYCFREATIEHDGYRGCWVVDSDPDPELGRRPRSFWLTRPSLIAALTEAGWAIRFLEDHPGWAAAPRIWLGCVRPSSSATRAA